MQQMWTDIDDYINSHLIPTDPRLQHALDNTNTQGFSNHLAVAPNQGMFLQMLIQMNQCKRVLELGTFGAYSTIWLAKALPEDGYLLTVEGRDTHVIIAQENIDFANMPTNIELKKGRGADIMKQLIAEGSEPFDLIFIDADKQSYREYFKLSLKLSHSGTIIVLDNVIRAGAILDENNKKIYDIENDVRFAEKDWTNNSEYEYASFYFLDKSKESNGVYNLAVLYEGNNDLRKSYDDAPKIAPYNIYKTYKFDGKSYKLESEQPNPYSETINFDGYQNYFSKINNEGYAPVPYESLSEFIDTGYSDYWLGKGIRVYKPSQKQKSFSHGK